MTTMNLNARTGWATTGAAVVKVLLVGGVLPVALVGLLAAVL